MEKTIPVDNGAEAFIELLNSNHVDYIFLNPGTDTSCIQEALSKFKALGRKAPEVILCLHESVAMSAAHGYFMVTGKPQVVIVHADMGPQQVGGALHNAQRGRAGIVLCSGRVPSSIEEGRMNQVHWMQEQFDQAGVVRGYVKWDYELRSAKSIHQVVQRAFQVATSEPSGPVYLCLAQDPLMEQMEKVPIPEATRYAGISSCGIDPATLNDIASVLLKAENPLIITGYTGRHSESVEPLVELAELLGARVISSQTKMNFPTSHILFGGNEANPFITKSDVLLVIDHDVPYIISRVKPSPNTKIIQIDSDALKENFPMWGFPTDFLIRADSSKVIPALNQVIRQKTASAPIAGLQARSDRVRKENQKMQDEWNQMATSKAMQKPISPEWLFHCLNEVLDEDVVVLGEPVTNTAAVLRQIKRTKPATYFQSGGSNLGWGLGAALGAKLADPSKTIVTLMGDGGFNFGCPTAAIWGASAYKAPFLCIIINNMRYNAPSLSLRQPSANPSYSEKTGVWIGVDIKPSPDYAAIARACFAYGEKVEEPGEIKAAVKLALEQVRSGKPAVLDIRVGLA